MSKTIEITTETIQKAIESKPTSLTGLWKTLGGSGPQTFAQSLSASL